MKTLHILSIFLLTLATIACKKDEVINPSDTGTNLQSGTWHVTLFSEDSTIETHHFNGYSFQFNSNGTVSATKDGNTVSGTWTAGQEDDDDDSQFKLILSFSTSPLNELNDDWDILEQTSSKIRLQDISGGNGGTDLLTFEKN